MATKFSNDKLFEACVILQPILDRLILVGGWALRVQMGIEDESRYRETRDIDYAIQMMYADDFRNVFEILRPLGFKDYVDSIQYKSEDERIEIHLMPYGEVEEEINTKEYFLLQGANESIEVGRGTKQTYTIRCADIVGIVVMKIFSFYDHLNDFLLDNHRSRKKDIQDLQYILTNYLDDTFDKFHSVKRNDKLDEEPVFEHFRSVHIVGSKIKKLFGHELIIEAKQKLGEIIGNVGVRTRLNGEDQDRFRILFDYMDNKYE